MGIVALTLLSGVTGGCTFAVEEPTLEPCGGDQDCPDGRACGGGACLPPGVAPPEAISLVVRTQEDVPVEIALRAIEHDTEEAVFDVVTGPSHGQLSCGACQGVTVLQLDPDAGFAGADSFTFRARAGAGTQSDLVGPTARVDVEVVSVNDWPEVHDAELVTDEDQPAALALETYLSDEDGDPLRVEIVSVRDAYGRDGAWLGDASIHYGAFLFLPAPNRYGKVAAELRVSDCAPPREGDGECESSRSMAVQVEVRPQNDAPLAVSQLDPIAAREGNARTVRIQGVDVDEVGLMFVHVDCETSEPGPSPLLSDATDEGLLSGPVLRSGDTTSLDLQVVAPEPGPARFCFRVSDGSLWSEAARVELEVEAAPAE